MRKRLFIWITSAYLVLCAVLGLALPANAYPGDATSPSTDSCVLNKAVSENVGLVAGSLLPVNRWANTLPLHSRLPGLTDPGSWGANIARSITQTAMSIGNGAWSMASMVTDRSQRFCMGTDAAASADTMTAALGKGFIDSGIFPAIVVVALIGLLYRASKGGHLASAAIRIGLAVAAAVMLYTGASQTSNTSYGTSGMTNHLGVGGPGWFANTINTNIQNLSAKPVEDINDMVQANNKFASSDQGTSKLDCRQYIATLNKKYKDTYADVSGTSSTKKDSTDTAPTQAQKAAMAGSIAPLTLNQMWLQTGYATWVNIQFGPTGLDPFGPKVGCRLLDYSTNQSPETIMDLTNEAAGTDFNNKASLAWVAFGENTQIDQAMVAWAACNDKNVADEKWTKLTPNPVEGADCEKFFTGSQWQWHDAPTPFDFPDDLKKNVDRIDNDQVEAYIEFLHGNRSSEALATALVYVVSSVVVSAVFCVLGIAVFVTKTALLVVAAMAIVVLMAGVVTAGKPGANDPVMNLLKHFVVLSFFAYATSALLAIVSLMTSIIAGLGSSAVGDGTLASSMWIGLSPLVAMILLTQVFKRLGVPSPFSVKGAAAWGAAAAGTGFLAGNAFNRQHQVNNAFDRAQNTMKNVATGNGLSPNRGARSERSGGMKPTAGNGGVTGYQEAQRRKATGEDLKAVSAQQAEAKQAARAEKVGKVKGALSEAEAAIPAVDGDGLEIGKTDRKVMAAMEVAGAPMKAAGNKAKAGLSSAKNNAVENIATARKNVAEGTKKAGAAVQTAVNDPKGAAKAAGAASVAAGVGGLKAAGSGAWSGAKATGKGITAGWNATKNSRVVGEVKRSVRGAAERTADKFADKPIRSTAKALGFGAAALTVGALTPVGAIAVAGGAFAAVGARRSWQDHRERRTATRQTRRAEMAAMQAETGLSRRQIRQAQKDLPAYRDLKAQQAKEELAASNPAGPAPDTGSSIARPTGTTTGSMSEASAEGMRAAPDLSDTPASGHTAAGVAVLNQTHSVGEMGTEYGSVTDHTPSGGTTDGGMEPLDSAQPPSARHAPQSGGMGSVPTAIHDSDADLAAMPHSLPNQQAPTPPASDAMPAGAEREAAQVMSIDSGDRQPSQHIEVNAGSTQTSSGGSVPTASHDSDAAMAAMPQNPPNQTAPNPPASDALPAGGSQPSRVVTTSSTDRKAPAPEPPAQQRATEPANRGGSQPNQARMADQQSRADQKARDQKARNAERARDQKARNAEQARADQRARTANRPAPAKTRISTSTNTPRPSARPKTAPSDPLASQPVSSQTGPKRSAGLSSDTGPMAPGRRGKP